MRSCGWEVPEHRNMLFPIFVGYRNDEDGPGEVIFKQISSNVVEPLYLGLMRDVGGCRGILMERSSEFPRGTLDSRCSEHD